MQITVHTEIALSPISLIQLKSLWRVQCVWSISLNPKKGMIYSATT